MYKLLYFIRRTWVAALFIVIELLAIRMYAHSTSYTQARMLSLSNRVTLSVHSAISEVKGYFGLRRENERLVARVAELSNYADSLQQMLPEEPLVVGETMRQYEYIAARVVSNSVNRPRNFITLNKGIADGVTLNMAVLSPEGYAVGTVVDCSEHFAVARTLLNTDFKLGGLLAKDGSLGSIFWRGGDVQTVEFGGVSKYAVIEAGDEVITAGFSHYFPQGAVIGHVETVRDEGDTRHCTVHLSADMPRLQNVILVRNTMADEAAALDGPYKKEQ